MLEILMVVIIIAILAAIALPQYLDTVERSRGAEALTNLSAIRQSELRYKAESPTGVYTGVMGDLDITPTTSAAWTAYGITVLNTDATATRVGGNKLYIDLTTGALCEDNAAQKWGQKVIVAGANCS